MALFQSGMLRGKLYLTNTLQFAVEHDRMTFQVLTNLAPTCYDVFNATARHTLHLTV